MRRALLVTLLAVLGGGGCYLFSDEPKARKLAGDTAPTASKDSEDPAKDAAGLPSVDEQPAQGPAGEVEGPAGCPSLLVGVEAGDRTIASACGSVTVRGAYRVEGGSLTLEPGVELRFEPGGALEVGRAAPGKLIVAGTADRPVRMVAAGEHAAGQYWTGLRLHGSAGGSRIEHLELVGAGTPEHAAVRVDSPGLHIEGLRVQSSAALALELTDAAAGTQLLETILEGTGVVARTTAMGVAGLLDLRLDPGAAIEVSPGKIDAPIEWPRNRYRVEGPIEIAGTSADARPAQLSLAPGVELGFGPAGRLIVGGLGPGVLSASASPLPKLLGQEVLPPPAPEAGEPTDDAAGFDDRTVLRTAGDAQAGAWSGILVKDEGELILRNIELAHGGSRDEGVIVAETGAKLSLEGCSLRDNLVGLELRGAQIRVEVLRDNEFIDTPVALRSSPALLSAVELGANRYAAGARVELTRGRIEQSASWDASGVELVLTDEVFVDRGATLTVTAGSRLRFAAKALLGVGYYEDSSLIIRGSADAPIEFAAWALPGSDAPLAPSPWRGVVLGPHAHKVRFEHLRMSHTADAGIELREEADATLVRVDCRDCGGPTVRWGCKSTVGNIAVSASGSTPANLGAPSGCP